MQYRAPIIPALFMLILAASMFPACSSSGGRLVPVSSDGEASDSLRVAPLEPPKPAGVSENLQVFEVTALSSPVIEAAVSGDPPGCVLMTRTQYEAALNDGLRAEVTRLKRREARLKFGMESESAAVYGTGRFAGDEYDVGAGVDELVLERQTDKMIAVAQDVYGELQADAGRRYLPESFGGASLIAVRCIENLDKVGRVNVSIRTLEGERITFAFRGGR